MIADPREEMMQRLLADAKITPKMRVFEAGCATGNLTFQLARLVGPEGHVVGMDRNEKALDAARERARQDGVSNVTFVYGDLSALSDEYGLFDAAVMRRVLMYLPDPAGVLRRIGAILRPSAVVVIQEQDTTMVPARVVPMPLHEKVHTWMWRTVEREGANLHIGFDLPSIFERAGLSMEHLRAEAVVQTPQTDHPAATIVRAMLPRILKHGVATTEEIDIDRLAERLKAERTATKATYIGDMVFGAWARKPNEPEEPPDRRGLLDAGTVLRLGEGAP